MQTYQDNQPASQGFDKDRGKKEAFWGPCDSSEQVRAESLVMHPGLSGWDDYVNWAKTCGVDWNTGGTVADVHHKGLLEGRLATLERQSGNFANGNIGGEATKRDDMISTDLREKFANVASLHPKKLKVMLFSTVQTNPYFILAHKFLTLKFNAVAIVPDENHAQACNEILAGVPGLSERLVYTSDWQDEASKTDEENKIDMVHFNAFVPYLDQEDLKELLQKVTTNAHTVIFNNVVKDKTGKLEGRWASQVYYGGNIPIRFLGPNELKDVMESLGYELEQYYVGPFNFRIHEDSAINKEAQPFDNYCFVRAVVPVPV